MPSKRTLAVLMTLFGIVTAGQALTTADDSPASPAEGASPHGAPQEATPAKPQKPVYRVPKAPAAIVVDGRLDEGTWETALSLDLPYEVNPGDNVPSQVRTQAYLAYDQDYVYAAFRATDPDRKSIHARYSDRDRAFQDDFVGLVIDTFNDERRAFEFFVNPVGVQMDLVQDDVSGNEDSSWDTIWKSAGQISDDGYVVEMAIPYTSLRFQSGGGDQTWGIDLLRIYPRDRRFLFALNRRDRNVNCYLCQVAKIVGFEGATPGANLEITPTLTGIRTDENPSFPASGLENGNAHSELGITGRWGITPNLTASGAINPDFSQVEADVAQLDVNEAFALFFPEKRPFFLEGSDYFDTPIQAVYTRTVLDPSWGAKLTGKQGKNVIGFFAAEDAKVNLIFPGGQQSGSGAIDDSVTDAVGRYRRDFGKNSALGALVTSRSGAGYSNQVAGFDALLRPAQTDTIRLQFLESSTHYPDAVASTFGQPVGDFSDHALRLTYGHDTKYWSAWTRYSDFGEGFRADLGFVPQVNYRQPSVGAERYWIGEPGAFFSRLNVGSELSWANDQAGNLLSNRGAAWFFAQGPRQSFLFLGGGHRVSAFGATVFDQGFQDLEMGIAPVRDVTLSLVAGFDTHFDFAFSDPGDPGAAREGDQIRLAPSMRYNMGKHVRFDLSHDFRRLENDDGRLFLANLSQITVSYQMTIRMFFRAILQYEDVKRNLSLYSLQCPGGVPGGVNCSLEPRSRSLFSQLLFSYKINPQTAFYLGYSGTKDGLEDVPLTRTSRTFFVKLGYAWVI